ncbi:hypothetical protein ABLE93_17375 [Xanthobacter sp. KR7-65]|uniref:hypothetical protein n=1 Tax=Xanthobacter sp. KR7-65 TaxID=3156612 RepID=UPI0032B5C158
MLRRFSWQAVLVRFALAYLVLAQAVLGGAAMAQHAGLRLAAGTDLLCSGGASDPDTGHDSAALCCVLGCAASAPAPLLDAPAEAFAPPAPHLIALGFGPDAAGAVAPALRLAFEATGPPARA